VLFSAAADRAAGAEPRALEKQGTRSRKHTLHLVAAGDFRSEE